MIHITVDDKPIEVPAGANLLSTCLANSIYIPHLCYLENMKPATASCRLCFEEFIHGLDGKMRYFKPIRIEMYTRIAEEIRKYDPEYFVYLCMENREVWQKSLGLAPSSDEELAEWLDRRV